MEGKQALNLPDRGVKIRHTPEGERIFDPIRRKWVASTPEEWVRQHVLNYLVHDLGCPPSLIAVERGSELNGLSKRADIVLHDREGKPVLLVECKAPEVSLGQDALDQASRYNIVFHVPFLMVTNGRVHYCCHIDRSTAVIKFLSALPVYELMCKGLRP